MGIKVPDIKWQTTGRNVRLPASNENPSLNIQYTFKHKSFRQDVVFTLCPEKYTLCNFLLFLGLIVCKETKRRPCIFSHRPRYKNPDFFLGFLESNGIFIKQQDFQKMLGLQTTIFRKNSNSWFWPRLCHMKC